MDQPGTITRRDLAQIVVAVHTQVQQAVILLWSFRAFYFRGVAWVAFSRRVASCDRQPA
jgi:hypothetical protein